MVTIWKEFVLYVLKGKEKVIMEVLGELNAIEALEREKRERETLEEEKNKQ